MAIATTSRRWPAVLFAGGAFVFTLALVLLENAGGDILYEVLLRMPGIDKAMHWVQYTAIFMVLWWALGRLTLRPWTRIGMAVAAGVLIGVTDELVQRTMANRSFELEDLAVDLAAQLAGAALVAPIKRRALTAAVVGVSLTATAYFAYDTHHRLVHYNRALLYERRQDLRGAREEYRKALAGGLATPGLYNSLAWAEIESGVGSPTDAVHFAQLALASRPADADTLDTYGWALEHVGRSHDALAALERARALKPGLYCIDYHLGVVLRSLSRSCEARAAFERQMTRFPDARESARARIALARTLCKDGV